MYSKDATNHNYSDSPLKLMRKYILAVDFILQGDLEDHYLNYLSNLDEKEYAGFEEEIQELIQEFQITEDQISFAAENFIKIPC
ncbi:MULTISPECIES: hypothetical protein [Cytobacillus]|uniref:hypothetical protein n=1 Tax=Cytobacillus TaxID=2675230 RepID=UPI002040C43B|nr:MULTISPECIES: hypothetical protein [Cytobacillus]MCM3394832.1 hypothetical protein [Cytobacillus oceanisediminis]UQX56091.1 hypothetical protein M5V91_10925 [Cytobacillus pseudoceanisediminis]